MIANSRTDLFFQREDYVKKYPTAVTGTVGHAVPLRKSNGEIDPDAVTGGAGNRVQFRYWSMGVPFTGDTGIFVGYARSYTGSGSAPQNRSGSKDPKLVKLSILKAEPKVSITATAGLEANDWYIPVDEKRKALPGGEKATDFAFRTPQKTAPSGKAVAVHDFEMSSRDVTTPTTANGRVKISHVKYLTKVIDSTDEFNGIVLPHGIGQFSNPDAPSSIFKTEISNKYVAIQVGRLESEKRVKLAYGDTELLAKQKLLSLEYWNYVPASVLTAQPTIVKNMIAAIKNQGAWVHKAGNTADVPAYGSGKTTNFIFADDAKTLRIDNIADGKTVTESYDILMIEETIGGTAKTGLFQLEGHGVSDNKFMAIALSEEAATGDVKQTARYAIAATIQDAKNALTAQTHPNLYRQIEITKTGKSVANLIRRSADVAGKPNPIVEYTRHTDGTDYYDPKSTYEYQFIFGPKVIITTISNEAPPVSHTYDMGIYSAITDYSADEGYYTLTSPTGGEGPDNGQVLGVKGADGTAAFQIQVSGRKYSKLDKPGGENLTGTVIPKFVNEGEIATTGKGQRHYWNLINTVNNGKNTIVKENATLTTLSAEPLASFAKGTGVEIQTPNGVYDPDNTMTYTFNADAETLQVITFINTARTVQNYNISIVENNLNKTLLYAESAKVKGTGAFPLDKQFIDVEIINEANFLIAYGDTKVAANSEARKLKNRASAYKYSYWTHERLRDFTSMDKRLIEKLRDISTTEQTYYEVEDWDIAKNAVAKTATGLVMMADERFFKNGGASRYANAKDGFFNAKDYYKFTIETLTTGDKKVDYIEINHYQGADVLKSTLKARIRMLADTSTTEGTFVILKGVKADGLEETTMGTELKNIFENSVLSIKINTDNQIMLGYSKASGILDAEMAAAKAQLATKMGGLSQYTPNMISEHTARQQHFVPYILSSNPTRTFVNAYGITKETVATTDPSGAGFKVGNSQMTFMFNKSGTATGVDTANRIYNAKIHTKSVSVLDEPNPSSGNEDRGDNTTDFMIQPLQVDSKERMIFKFHKPTDTGTATASDSLLTKDTAWKNLLLNSYQAVEIGTGGNLLQYKWVHGDSVADVTTKLNKQAFFNGSHYWGATTARRVGLDKLTAWQTPTQAQIDAVNASDSKPLPAWKKQYTLYHHKFDQPSSGSASHSGTSNDQDLFLITEPNSSANVTLTFRKVPNYEGTGAHYPPKGYNYTLQLVQNGDTIGMYEVTPKDIPSQGDGSRKYALGVTGIGAMNGYVIFMSNDEFKTTATTDKWRMIWVNPKDGDQFGDMVEQFLHNKNATGTTWLYSRKTINLKANPPTP